MATPKKPKTEQIHPRLIQRGDVIQDKILGVKPDVVRAITIIYHMANGMDFAMPDGAMVTRIVDEIDPTVLDKVREIIGGS